MANYLHIDSIDLNYDPHTLLNAVITHLHLKNDAALCRVLEVAPPVISKIRHAKLPIGATMLISMHEVTGISIKELRALMGDRRPSFHEFEPVNTKTLREDPAKKSKEESDLLVALYRSMNPEGQKKLLQLSQHMVKLSDLTQEKTVPINGVMTQEFDDAAKAAVRKAVQRANARGLPRAYVESTPRPVVPVIVTIPERENHA
jgi:hypothetical protein